MLPPRHLRVIQFRFVISLLLLLQATVVAEGLNWRELEQQIQLHRQLIKNCGPLSVARVARLAGHEVDLQELMNQCDYPNGQGVRLGDVVRISQMFEPRTIACRVEPDKLNGLPLPCILVVNNSRHCLVLEKRLQKNVLQIWDPSVLESKAITQEDLRQQWDGKVIITPRQSPRKALPHVVVIAFGLTFLGLRWKFGRGRRPLGQSHGSHHATLVPRETL